MERGIFIILLVFLNISVHCQDSAKYRISLSLSTGFTQYASNNQLLNYYTYAGNGFLPLKFMGRYANDKNILQVTLFYHQARLHPRNVADSYYEYNYIKNNDVAGSIQYHLQVFRIGKFLRIFIGAANNSYLIFQEEDYNSTLYDYAKGNRKSFDLSVLNLSPNILFDCNLSKNHFYLYGDFTVLSISALPDDNYVKQNGAPSHIRWNSYSLRNRRSLQLSAFYEYNFPDKISVTAGYDIIYHAYKSADAYKYLSRSLLIGIAKKF